jgi:hypothetical protein
MRFFTVGHSNQTLTQLIELLQSHGTEAGGDVLSTHYRGVIPQFNRNDVEAELLRQGITNVFLGDKIGARRDEPGAYEGLQPTC